MATSESLLSEEQFLCSICLDVFTEPVAIPCGHNFCMACIRKYWDSNDLCQCPVCKKNFDKRPDLFVNTFISEMVAQFRKSVQVTSISSPDQSPVNPGEVACDVCAGTKLKALKSCLVCLTSYCETHLEPHQRVTALKRHKLIDPVDNLEDRMCKKHQRLPELYCRTDRTCVCVLCIPTDHKTHDTVPIEEEYREKMATMMAEVQKTMQTRLQNVEEIKRSVELSETNAEKEIAEGVEVFTALVRFIERSQAEFVEVVEEKRKAAERRAEELRKELEQEITELQRRSTELEQLSLTEDHLHFLQNLPSQRTPPQAKDRPEISLHSDLSVLTLKTAVEETLNTEMEKLPDVKLKRLQKYAVDVTLDPDTAFDYLILSEDGKQVRLGNKQAVPDNPKRFCKSPDVLAKEGFASGRFYFEVQVKGKTEWVVGVATESVSRKDNCALSPLKGYWTMFLDANKYEALTKPHFLLSLKQKPQKLGVFVDYEKGLVSFYDVEARSHIYSFTGCFFTEKLYPYLGLQSDDGDKNLAPLIISPVNHTG